MGLVNVLRPAKRHVALIGNLDRLFTHLFLLTALNLCSTVCSVVSCLLHCNYIVSCECMMKKNKFVHPIHLSGM